MDKLCSNPDILKAVNIIKQILDMVIAIVPIILIVVITITLTKAIIHDDEVADAVRNSTKKLIIAAFVFVVPNIILTLLSAALGDKFDEKLLCVDIATVENIDALTFANSEKEKAEVQFEKEEEEKKEEERKIEENSRIIQNQDYTDTEKINPYTYISSTFTPIVDGVQRPLKEGECMNWEDNCFCPNKTNAKGFQFIMEDAKGRTFKATTADSNMAIVEDKCGVISNRDYLVVSADVKNNFEQAMEKLCVLKNVGINIYKINTIKTNGTYAMRMKADRTVCSPHSYGIAVDFNSGVTFDYNGRTFDPYTGQGLNTRKNYGLFIGALGSELHNDNVNYVIWKYAFEPAGFDWGGSWYVSSFDPMHYEVLP